MTCKNRVNLLFSPWGVQTENKSVDTPVLIPVSVVSGWCLGGQRSVTVWAHPPVGWPFFRCSSVQPPRRPVIVPLAFSHCVCGDGRVHARRPPPRWPVAHRVCECVAFAHEGWDAHRRLEQLLSGHRRSTAPQCTEIVSFIISCGPWSAKKCRPKMHC